MARKGARRFSSSRDEPRVVGGSESGRMREISRGISKETGQGRVNDRELVRLAIGNHPRASTTTIVKTLRKEGITVSHALVEHVCEQMRGGGRATGLKGGGQPKGNKGKKAPTTGRKRTRADGLT